MTSGGVLLGGTALGGIVGSASASVAAGIFANDVVPEYLHRIPSRLEGSREQLSNHDLTQAVGLAIGLVIKSIAEAGTYPNSTKDLKTLAENSVKVWQEVARELQNLEADQFESLQEEENTSLFLPDSRPQTVLTVEDWRELLQKSLCPKANVTLRNNVLQEVATQLHQKFAAALREVIKADFESGGKAFAGLVLDFSRLMMERLETLGDGENGQALIAQLQTFQEELKADQAGRLQALAEEIDSGFNAVLQELGVTQEKITEIQDWLQQELEEIREYLKQIKEGLDEVKEQNVQIQEQNVQIQDTVDEVQDTVDEVKEHIIGFLEPQQKPKVQAVSYRLDTNPPRVTHWQGRENDLATVNRWLEDENTKLGVIHGIAGMGKSTLAAKVFQERTDFEEKLWLDLGQRPNYSTVATGILQQLGKLSSEELQQIEETRLTQVAINCLGQHRFLLVLDNLESVLQDAGYQEFLQQWVGKCHQTEILVTTQEVPPLSQVKPTELPLGGLSPEEGQQLLQALGISGTEEALQAFADKVSGHPLTLTLVAGLLNQEMGEEATIDDLAKLGLADVEELLANLEGYHRDEIVQLVAVLEASFNRLSEKLKQVLFSLVVLRQGFDAEVASAMSGEEVTRKEMRGLAKRGLLEEETKGVYQFQPFIGEYLRYQAGDLTKLHRQAIEFYQTRYQPRETWETVADVQGYLEVFYHWCQLGKYETAFDVIRKGDQVNEFLTLRGNYQIKVELYQQLVEGLPDQKDWRYTTSLTSLGNAYYFLGRYQDAIAFQKQSLAIKRKIGDRREEATSLIGLGNAYRSLGHYEDAIAFHEQALAIKRDIGDRGGEATSLIGLGNAYKSLGRYEEAIAVYEQALAIFREIGDRGGEAGSLVNLGNAYKSLGRYEEAIAFYEQPLAICRDIGDRGKEATSLGNLGAAYDSLGRYEEAIAFHEQALAIKRDIGDRGGEANSLNNLGNAYKSLGRYEEAIAFHEQSLAITRDIGDRGGEATSLNGLGNAYQYLGRYEEAIAFHEQSLAITRDIGDRGGEANSLFNLGLSYQKVGRIKEGFAAYQQAVVIYQELDLPLNAYPDPKWMKQIAQFAQRSKFHLVLCFILGVFAFPFALVGLVLLLIYRLIRRFFSGQ
jgi:tetratricopeptide (TPR) repeat protein